MKFLNKDEHVKQQIEETIIDLKNDILENPTDEIEDESWIECCNDLMYAISLGFTCFEDHLAMWQYACPQSKSDKAYVDCVNEIIEKINCQLLGVYDNE
jgi:hypothetical protein